MTQEPTERPLNPPDECESPYDRADRLADEADMRNDQIACGENVRWDGWVLRGGRFVKRY